MRRTAAIILVVFLLFSTLRFVVDSNISYANVEYGKNGSWNANKAEELRKYGFIEGYNGDLMTDKLLTRQQLAILICELQGVKEVASRYDVAPRYKDLDKIPSWSRNYIAYCQKEKWMIGKQGSFDPTGPVTGQELAKAMLNALGYQDVPWKKSLDYIKTLGIVIPPKKSMTRGQSFDVMWDVVSRPIMKSGEILGVKTGRLGEGAVAFRATKVEMLSLKSFRVHFNRPVDPDSVEPDKLLIQVVETKKQDEVGGLQDRMAGAVPRMLRAEVVLGGLAVDFYLSDAILHQVDIHYDVFGIRSAEEVNGVQHTMALFSGVMNALDQSLPVVERVVIAGDKLLDIYFSEPITSIGTVEIDEGNAGLSVLKYGARGIGTNKLSFAVTGAFRKGVSYTFTIKGFKDIAGYANVNHTSSAAIGDVVIADKPSVKAGAQAFEYVELVFSTPVKGITKERFYHSYDIYKALKVTKKDSFHSEEVKPYEFVDRVYVWFYDFTVPNAYAIPGEGATLHIEGKNIVDGFGSTLGKQQMVVVPQGIIDAPKVLAVEVVDLSTLRIIFDRVVVRFSMYVKDRKTGESMAPAALTEPPAKEFLIRLGAIARGDLDVSIIDAIDAGIGGQKQNGEAFFRLAIGDKIPPKVQYVVRSLKDGKASLLIAFDEVVEKGALIASNYQILVNTPSGKVYRPLTSKPEFLGHTFTVVGVELTTEEFRSMAIPAQIMVKDVADASGNMGSEIVEIKESMPFFVVGAFTQGKNEVIAKLFTGIDVLDPEGFMLGDKKLAVGSMSYNDSGDTILNLVLANEERFDAVTAGSPGNLIIKKAAIANFTGESNSEDIRYASVYDKAKPYVEKVGLLRKGVVRFTFNELMYDNRETMAQDFVIEADSTLLEANRHFIAVLNDTEREIDIYMQDVPIVQNGTTLANEAKEYKIKLVPRNVKDKNHNEAEEASVILKNLR